MYEVASTTVRIQGETIKDFLITITIHQILTLNLYRFVAVLNVLTKHIQKPTLKCMLFADDIFLFRESVDKLNEKFKT